MSHEIILENGLRVVVFPSPAPPLAYVQGIVRAGSFLYPNPYVPIFASRLLMRGTTRYSREKLEYYCDRFALDIGFDGCGPFTAPVNGVSPSRFLGKLLGICAHVLQSPSFPPEELVKVKQEAVSFITSQADSPEACALAEGTRMLYARSHPLFELSAEARLEFIQQASLEQIRHFWDTRYEPSRTALVVVGDVDVSAVESLARSTFGGWGQKTAPGNPASATQSFIKDVRPPHAEERVVDMPEKPSAIFWAGQALPIASSHPDYPALLIALGILGLPGGMTSRLYYEVREKRGYSYSINALAEHMHEFPGFWRIIAHTNPDNIRKVRDEVFRVLDEFVALGVSQDEVRMTQVQLRGQRRLRRASLSGIASEGILDLTAGQTDFAQRIEDGMMRVSPEDVNNAIKKYINPSALAVVMAGTIER